MSADVELDAELRAGAEAPRGRRAGTPVDGVDVLYALSPSRASEFTGCPLLYRFRSVDRLPEPPSPEATRGTLVHKVLEDLFDLPADERTPDRAGAMLEPVWEQLLAEEPGLAAPFGADGATDADDWLASCHAVLRRYFDLEDPRRLEPAEREVFVEAVLDSGLLLRGVIDRVDQASDGALRLTDYKTGKAAREGFEQLALFQLRFYALVLWRTRGVVPRSLRLLYLGDATAVTYEPDEADLVATERRVEAVWRALRYAEQTGDYRPRRSARCRWCPHKALCPAWGGTPPPLPADELRP
jgi:putative RecB family exonuclease